MRRVSVDIGGTFTDCFLVWDDHYVTAKALTTHQNLALGFNASLAHAYDQIGLSLEDVMQQVDSVRYATTLGTNALIERRGPKVGLITTAGFESTVPLSRGRGYGEGVSERFKKDLPMAERPDPIVPIPLIAGVRERLSERGEVIMPLDEEDVRKQVRRLVDRGAQAYVVSLVNSVVNPAHEIRVEEIIREEYPEHTLGSAPIILAHMVVGRKGEYARTSSAIIDAFLHKAMYLGLSSLELNLRDNGHERPMQVVHNSGGMAQLNSTDALQTIHSGPVAGISASEHLAAETDIGNIVCSDMGGTSFDIGLVVKGGVKFYDFNPVIERWMVNVPMVHLVTLGAGGGSIARYDRLRKTIAVGPESAGSDPGPACYDKGGRAATVTDADLVLGYLQPDDYAGGRITLNEDRAKSVMRRTIGKPLDIDEIEVAKLIKQKIDNDMANGIAQELRARGYEPDNFTLLSYGGNGALHACGIASVIGINRVFVPPFSSIFSAVGAGNMDQLHIHERSLYLQVYDSGTRKLLSDFDSFNAHIEQLEERGKADLIRQGYDEKDIEHRLELDMRYGNQLAQTAVVVSKTRIENADDLLDVIGVFGKDYGKRYGEGSQAPEAGIRVNTVRVASYVQTPKLKFSGVLPKGSDLKDAPAAPVKRACYFVGHDDPIETGFYDLESLDFGSVVQGPAVITSQSTTFLVEPGWQISIGKYGSGWLQRSEQG
ncbi:hydantoinase/oxoprolinase family protein [Kordiimonas pumila]|uniref:Hydantoinase/oxoprolinase family protein n=1 Tax=Kordiimonas pumila TaxID=2161677 RepID=A0ABV7D7H3_9PROT|nr:hydantoinase/oxoprolinase family protein [Kordiimonas pumila]